ncbi:MAG: EamA family transporter [Bacteroidetes bacterium]|nr:EamA family transporter [Bacteroidota bacterium]
MEWVFLAFISALLSAIAAVSQKKVLFDLDALEFSFVLSIFNMLFSLLFFLWVDFSDITALSLVLLYIKTIFGALAFLCVMLAIKNMEISGALPLLALTPGFVAIAAFVFLGESLSIFELIGMGLLLFGTYLLESGNKKDLLHPFKIFASSKYHHYILLALLLFTTTSIMDKLLLKNHSLHPYAFMGFQQLFIAINFSIIILFVRKSYKMVVRNTLQKSFLWILVISILTIGYRYTQIEAIKLAPVALVLSVKRISVFFAVIFGGRLFKEHNLFIKVLATVILILGAIFIINS